MEGIVGCSEAIEDGKKVATGPKKLSLALPPRNATEAFLRGADGATPSPMTFVSSLFADQDPYAGDYKSFSQLLAGAIASPTASHPLDDGLMTSAAGVPPVSVNNTPSAGGVPGPGGRLPPRSNSAKFKSMMPPSLPIPRSSYLTIPAGLSPTTLLDSPLFLSTSWAEPSPTSGTFFFPPSLQDAGIAGAGVVNNSKDESNYGQDGSPTFIFKPHPQLPNSPLASMGPYGLSHQQALAQVQAQASSQTSGSSAAGASAVEPSSTALSIVVSSSLNSKLPSQTVAVLEPPVETSRESSERSLSSSHTVVPAHPPLAHLVERPSEDGYNWRKYGQKQVKGSEYPRSYYKCTHPGCPVKKKVERSYEGQITEIVYKGDHNHPKPPSTRRSGSSQAHVADTLAREASHVATLDRANALYETSKADNGRGQLSGALTGTSEPSLASTSGDEAEDGGDGESDPKRMKLEKAREPIANLPLRTIREPRVVVQTTSEVDILDDGYRWRKYGQKVVKGNPHPRSYYKCTNVGCTVRKHVERSSTDPKSVITTYEGKHNHDVPAARNSNHEAGVSTTTSTSMSKRPAPGIWDSNGEGRGARSLQEQLFGKPLEGADMETHSGGSMYTYNQDRTRESIDKSAQPGVSMMNSYAGGLQLHEGGEYFGQSLALRPKEEPEEAHPLDAMQSSYQQKLRS